MKANELRIGNCVLYENEYREIGHIMNDGRLGIVLKGCSRVIQRAYVYDEELRPIPLTEEILLKAGFVKLPHKNIGDSMIKKLGRGKHLSISNRCTPNEIIALVDDPSDDIMEMPNVHIIKNYDYDGYTHLHQLQNLYFVLTGEELNIQL